jgi:probable HAF family extracellular repeat protein
MKNAFLLSAFVVATLASTRSLAQYNAYDLGGGEALGINSYGTVVGYTESISVHHAFSYSDGVMTDLGAPLGGSTSSAKSINNAGVVVGTSDCDNGYWHAFTYSGSQFTDLGVYSSLYSFGRGINDSGLIVGTVWTTGNKDHAAFYSSGHWTDLGTLGGNYSAAAAVNSSGTIVGWSDLSYGTHAFTYRDGVMTDLGTFGGSVSYGLDINNSGVVVGYGTTPNNYYYQAFRYSDGVMTCIGTLGGAYSYANAVNSSGVIVGAAEYDASGEQHAFRYSNGQMIDLAPYLAPLGLTGRSAALDINDRGDIVGRALDAEGTEHAFLLAVPEPSVGAVLVLGAGMVLVRRRGFYGVLRAEAVTEKQAER